MPAKERIPDYYEILGIDFNSDADSIKKAYRSLAKAFHPDTSTHPNAKERFQKITKAYEILGDSAKREEYNTGYNSDENIFPDEDDVFSKASEETDEYSNVSSHDNDEFSIMADYEFYSDETENFLVNGQKKIFKNARHIIVKDTEYIIDGDELINIGGIHSFTHEGYEKYLIDGEEKRVFNAKHYYQNGSEFVIIDNKPYRIKSF